MRPTVTLGSSRSASPVDCAADSDGSLRTMFVDIVQDGRVAAGQRPVLRPVFLKPHGVAHGTFRIRPDLPEAFRIGLFGGTEYPAWIRFSSDTLPTASGFKTTLGIGIKLFGVAGEKLFGEPRDGTFDFILQNHDVFFVDTASDMCAFTRAGVVDGDYDLYLKDHPKTVAILGEMAKSVASVLATPYWSGVPFALGPAHFVKYKLEPEFDLPPPAAAPSDPSYLALDLRERLASRSASFRFLLQPRTDPDAMPLDRASIRWSEAESAPVHVADLVLPQQDIAARGQAEYGENLSMNIWRVTEDHRPQGSLAEARRSVYAASADRRRNLNGVPLGEPDTPKPETDAPPGGDTVIVRAAIHPGIGIARIGDSADECFVGPEVVETGPYPPGFHRDAGGDLKRQAARFRIYGYNAAGEVVSELTTASASIRWTAHLANRKAAWYRFIMALDIPDAAAVEAPRRNSAVPVHERAALAIDPGPRSISGAGVAGGAEHAFDTGKFGSAAVALGELRTDEKGRLLVLGGRGRSGSPSGAPIFTPADGDTFANADGWYDDISDGPVTAQVSIEGRDVPVQGAWVAVAPPNYAPDLVGWRTLYDLLVETYIEAGMMPRPATISFQDDVLPLLRRLAGLQWVNKGFANAFGKGRPWDFSDDDFVGKLASKASDAGGAALYGELRWLVLDSFRPSGTSVDEPRLWPWFYGDAFGFPRSGTPRGSVGLSPLQSWILHRWVSGDFESDFDPAAKGPHRIEQLPLAQQPAMLDRAALHFCLADAFHPGCELTWIMRHASLYEAPFRIRRRPADDPEPDYGKAMTSQIALAPGGPLYGQPPGGLTRWMAVPWQADTVSCLSGYEPEYDPFLPSFWPARVPNHVLTQAEYDVVKDTSRSREDRLAAFWTRRDWFRGFPESNVPRMNKMVEDYAKLGVVEVRPGIANDPDFPEVMLVETARRPPLAGPPLAGLAPPAEAARSTGGAQLAGWSPEELEVFRRGI
ncbi:LodA/GoxA family CTQ-dependent oxidase [Enterovirga sp.]|uniref:LodA/GoxA family CTQ-dependent oxidase n=2 Tax=Enterovirga sp. TaxID=2026350 RepID=UPI002BBFE681|nr:LodA/GoxA family CTQ-dependent oxidase [Enterovirga sp.]HMO29482.1 LodA/GoxA family CTQ-dependent oxidase [Enterovirga sp.]